MIGRQVGVVLALILLSSSTVSLAVDKPPQQACLENAGPDPEFATAFIAALTAKKVPLEVRDNCAASPEGWRINLSSTEKEQGTARAWLLGHRRTDSASITVKDKDGKYIWGYNVLKINSRKYQSTAEACAKHLKKKIEDDEKITRKSGTAVRSIMEPAERVVPVQAASTPQPPAAPVAPSESADLPPPVIQVASVTQPPAPTPPVVSVIRIVCPEKVSEVPFSSSRPDRRHLACDEPITIVSEGANWIRVKTSDGVEGNVAVRFVGK